MPYPDFNLVYEKMMTNQCRINSDNEKDGKMSLNVVLDTNIFVAAAFNPGSSSMKLVESIRAGQTGFVWDEATRAETLEVLNQIPRLQQEAYDDLFTPGRRFQGKTHPENYGEIGDPDDRKFAALAEASGAVLVSNDDHLLSVRERLDVEVLTPREAVLLIK
jgi:uncharacterized protein